MRMAILSDIHGNMIALNAVIADMSSRSIDKIAVLGDIITDFPDDTNNIIDIIKDIGDYIIIGNREYYLLNKYKESESIQLQTMKETYAILSDKNKKYIETLPEQIALKYNDAISIRCVHGSPFLIGELLYSNNIELIKKCLNSINERILLYGHTHFQWYDNIKGKYIINPGSVGINYDGKSTAQYTIIENSLKDINIEQYSIKYDINEVKNRYSIDNTWINLIINGIIKGRNIPMEYLAEANKRYGDGIISNDNWVKLYAELKNSGIIVA
jgi:putative phosphoesterase